MHEHYITIIIISIIISMAMPIYKLKLCIYSSWFELTKINNTSQYIHKSLIAHCVLLHTNRRYKSVGSGYFHQILNLIIAHAKAQIKSSLTIVDAQISHLQKRHVSPLVKLLQQHIGKTQGKHMLLLVEWDIIEVTLPNRKSLVSMHLT
jgi:hypothetical protein